MNPEPVFPVRVKEYEWQFRVWAPHAEKMTLRLTSEGRDVDMHPVAGGYWSVREDGLKPGTRYRYRIDGGDHFPDPASLSQPDGVHGDSELVLLDDFRWTDQGWKNIPLDEMIQYELHTGTFSPSGNFEGIAERLGYLADLGINAIELMPVGQFSGERNWGYDGAYPFAVHDSYGGAKRLMSLVDACHRKGIAVILDVVYNHFGPEGNYVSQFGDYFSGNYSTPWGKPVNFDGPLSDQVRDYILQNAMMWFRDFHIDALRLDAVHAIYDLGAKHVLQEMAEKLKLTGQSMNKPGYLIAESHLNDVRMINPAEKGGYGLDAQWSDDFHHAVHALTTGERDGYYMDYGDPGQLAKAMKEVFIYNGQYSEFRKKSYGNSTEGNPGDQFVIFSQNHDQVGNRKLGERLISLTGFETAKLVAGTMFITPNIPMLFMGEEYGERNPFYYFVSHLDPELNMLVRKGRENEFRDFQQGGKAAPHPDAPESFEQSKLSWGFGSDPEQGAMLRFYKELIRLRKHHPVLRATNKENIEAGNDVNLLWAVRTEKKDVVFAFMNYSDKHRQVTVPREPDMALHRILESCAADWKGPGTVSPESTAAGEKITVREHSIVIYSNLKA